MWHRAREFATAILIVIGLVAFFLFYPFAYTYSKVQEWNPLNSSEQS